MAGRIQVDGNWDAVTWLGRSRPLSGELTIQGDCTGIIVTQYGEISGAVRIDGNLTGEILTLTADLSGDLTVGGNLTGRVAIGLDPQGLPDPSLRGTVTVHGDMTGRIYVYGDLRDSSDPNDPDMTTGHIIIDGSFGTSEPADCNIIIGGTTVGLRAFIAVDYDGWHEPDVWFPSAYVRVLANSSYPYTFYGNTPEWNVWEITECRGDMNNDGAVDVADLNPFIQALTSVRSYSLAFPGLGALEDPWDPNAGSRVYHGDCNCDGFFDFGDINPFVLRLNQGCCWEECGDCPGGNGLLGGPPGGLPEPELLAAKLAVNVKPELFDDLVDMAAAAASVQTDPQLKVYWEKVHRALRP